MKISNYKFELFKIYFKIMDNPSDSNNFHKMSEDVLIDDNLLDMVTPLPFDENGDNIPMITEVPEDDG